MTIGYSSRVRALAAVLVLLALCCFAPALSWAEADPVAAEIERRLAQDALSVDGHRLDPAELKAFYQPHGFAPLWLGTDGGRRRAGQLLRALAWATREALRPADYAEAAVAARRGTTAPVAGAELDLLITHELLHFVSDLRSGRVSAREVDPELFIYPGKIDRAALIEGAQASRSLSRFLTDYLPTNPVYERLKRSLARHRAIQGRGGWPRVAGGGTLREGVASRRVKALRQRLEMTGDLNADAGAPMLFDERVAQAVERFQRRHGLNADGAVGPGTLAVLNVPVERRIEQIILNMERWRWMPDDLGQRYILVNMAGFELQVIEDGWTVMDMRVVVGRPYRRTPVFSSKMTYLVINPAWNVPASIAKRDYLPKLRKNPRKVVEHQIRVLDSWNGQTREVDPMTIDWSRVSASRFPYILRQDPGHQNALGRIKFMLPNRFSIYLHDTPSVHLFERQVRTFSSGCIRLQEPFALADYLLKDSTTWNAQRIEEEILSGRTTNVTLPAAMPVHVTYMTAWVDEEGATHFHNDIYGRDDLLRKALFR